jgi:iron complex outermembrane receptor protein
MRVKPLVLAAPMALLAITAHAQTIANSHAHGAGERLRMVVIKAQRRIFKSAITEKIISKSDIESVSNGGSVAQALALSPGVNVSSYSNSAGAKYSVNINGLKSGWQGFGGGNIDNGSLQITFDGVPFMNPGTGFWQTSSIPELSLLQGVGVTFGPGPVASRWFDNIGGTVNFVPLQPGGRPGADVGFGYGSYSTRNVHASVTTATYHGWSAVLAGGATESNSYRRGFGFHQPGKAYAAFFKVRKKFQNGSISLGAYDAYGGAYRPLPIPLSPLPGVTVNGLNVPGQPYSQTTSGFYGSLPFNVIHKWDSTGPDTLIYGRLRLRLSRRLRFASLLYYRHGRRFHYHDDQYLPVDPFQIQLNNPYSYTVGDKSAVTALLPFNTIKVGAFILGTTYNSRAEFWSPNLGATEQTPAGFRNDFWYLTDFGAFLQDHIALPARLSVTPGIRFVNFHTQYENDSAATYPQANPASNEAVLPSSSTNFAKLEPNLAASWRVLPWFALYGNWGYSYRQPPNGGGGGPYQALVASSLRLEKGDEYQFGFKMHAIHARFLHRFLLGANYYHLLYSDESISVAVLNQPFAINASGSSLYHGINVYADDNPIERLHVFMNLSFQSSTFQQYSVNNISYSGLPVSNIADKTANFGASYGYDFDSTLFKPRIWYQYVGKQYLFDDLTAAPTRQAMPSYGTLNVAVKVTRFIPPSVSTLDSLTLSLVATNVLDRHYNIAEYVTAGGYFGPTSAGQTMGFPGAPFMIFADVTAHFRP